MNTKEKAIELIDKYINADFNCKDCDMPFCDAKCTILTKYEAKYCALIAVDEILKVAFYSPPDCYNFYLNVKVELDKL